MLKRECTICKVQQDWTGKPYLMQLSGGLYCEECAKTVLEEKIAHIVCSDCGKELDSNSARIIRRNYYEPLDEVNFERLAILLASGRTSKEMILCSTCAKQFRKKMAEAEWQGMKVSTVISVLMLFGMMVALIILVLHLSK